MDAEVPRKIIVDCDPGHDDAVALLLASTHPGLDILAVTTVAGNSTIANVTRNALGLAELLDITAPVAAGATRPLVANSEDDGFHGETGLSGVTLPATSAASPALDPRHAVDLIIELVMSHAPGEITLVPTGPFTNIALAVRREPRIARRVREVVLMGGAADVGNMTATAEFNVWFDPEAAEIVFSAGWPVRMVGLDVTMQALATPAVIERARAIGTARGRLLTEMLDAASPGYLKDGFPGPALHDVVAVAAVVAPELVEFEQAPIRVELTGTHTRGMTVVDRRRWIPRAVPTQYARALDVDGFWNLLLDAAARP
ncbi:MAG: nucleoside hydrolase [Microbacteriaceae bacterium]|nr:nucleoside hydrolase [Microbacteriaceae bacterium]MCL2794277.1 nucleoside hydrolase [Microbacteriaceae bacterium]